MSKVMNVATVVAVRRCLYRLLTLPYMKSFLRRTLCTFVWFVHNCILWMVILLFFSTVTTIWRPRLLGNRGSIASTSWNISLFLSLDWPWDPPSCVSSGYCVLSGLGIKLNTHLHRLPRLRIRTAILRFPHTFPWRGKVKCSRDRPGVAQRVGRGIALLFHDRGTRRGWVVSSTHRPHFSPGKDPVPLLQEAGWAPGPFWTGGRFHPHRDSIPDRPARSQSLYRLSYPAHSMAWCLIKNTGSILYL